MCINCKQSSYQSEKWQTECKPCLNDKITDGEGKTSESDCVTNCANGHGYNYTSGTCMECPRGTYRIRVEAVTAPLTPRCVPCPAGKTTERTGSLTKDQCNIADCREGAYFSADKQSCIVCPRGEYQDKPWQENGCKKCPDGKTTPSNHSTSVTDCKRDCPSGRELDETTGDCDLCRRGFYKDQAQHFNCQQCPSGLTTQSTGSTSASDCNQGTQQYYLLKMAGRELAVDEWAAGLPMADVGRAGLGWICCLQHRATEWWPPQRLHMCV
ncbi:hypothetical protein LSAT2_000963 [Lamellibrachia satsuma]|nr:hypothetical protein LSAT2_000963 [Lamellibrachia satsuma]